MRREWKMAAVVGAALTAAVWAGTASAAPIGPSSGLKAVIDGATLTEQAQFIWGGRNYCWYVDGWHGPGWYWCGYAFRSGYGWGGGHGWRGWYAPGYGRGWVGPGRMGPPGPAHRVGPPGPAHRMGPPHGHY